MISGVLSDDQKGGAGARLSQALREGNWRGSAAISRRKDRSFLSASALAEHSRSSRNVYVCGISRGRQIVPRMLSYSI